MTIKEALEVLRKQSNCWDKITECSANCEECECHVDASSLVEAVKTVLDNLPTQMSGTSNSSAKFKPGDKFLLEIGEKRIGLDEYSIVGTDLYVWGSLLEKLTPYEAVQAERKKGHWIPVDDPSINGRCSVCGFESHLYENDVYEYDYCPNCGARLVVVDE